MRKKPNISVIVPTLNRPKSLALALRSVLKQTFPPTEILVIDDGSETDSVDKTIQAINDSRVHLFKHTHNKGANSARNTGIINSHGDYLAFIDDDDYWLPSKLEKQIAMFDDRPEYGAVYCGKSLLRYSSMQVDIKTEAYPEGNLFKRLLVSGITNPTSTYLIRRACIDEVGMFDENLPARQDWDLFIRISEKFKIGCAQEILVLLGEDTGPRISWNFDALILGNKYIYRKYENQRYKAGLQVQLAAFSHHHYELGNIHNYAHDGKYSLIAAREYLVGAIAWPFFLGNHIGLARPFIQKRMYSFLSRLYRTVFYKQQRKVPTPDVSKALSAEITNAVKEIAERYSAGGDRDSLRP